MGVEKFYIEKGSAESSVIFSSGCFVAKAFAFQRLKFRLCFNIMAYFIHECLKGIVIFFMS